MSGRSLYCKGAGGLLCRGGRRVVVDGDGVVGEREVGICFGRLLKDALVTTASALLHTVCLKIF